MPSQGTFRKLRITFFSVVVLLSIYVNTTAIIKFDRIALLKQLQLAKRETEFSKRC